MNQKKESKTCQEYLEGWKRAKAEFLNYKKEEEDRINYFKEDTKERMILKLLPVLDNLRFAQKQISKELQNDESVKGVLQIGNQIEEFIKTEGIEEIECKGKEFDPRLHEAIDMVEGKESNIVIEEIKKGYLLNNKVIRPAQVKISK